MAQKIAAKPNKLRVFKRLTVSPGVLMSDTKNP
jgi:hypothetical protein